MKKLAIIGSGRMAWIFGKNASEMDIETHAFSFDNNPIAIETVSQHHLIDIMDYDAVLTECKKIGINGVVATTELTVPVAAYIAEKMGLPGIKYQNAKNITDKYRNRILCCGLPALRQPQFKEVSSISAITNSGIGFPIILKPTSKGGKRGISVVYTPDELDEAYQLAKKYSGASPIIVEEFIEGGQEFSVESLSYQGEHYIIQITEKITSGPPHCVELGHHQPAAISKDLKDKIRKAVSSGLSAIGVDNSTCHTEIKLIGNDIYLIEFNARPGGDHIAWPLTELSTGYPYIKGAIQVALGDFKGVDVDSLQNNYAGVYFVTTQTSYLKPLFDKCDDLPWLYKKNFVSEELQSLEHNDCYGTNSIMYFSKEGRPDIEQYITAS